jgi:aminoglycoside phosphotransferase (APT) family kinase protein
VIDFGDCRLGDPAGDFGSLWTYGKAFITSVYEQYTGPKDEQFLARSLLYFKKLGLSELTHAVKGEFGSWESMYPFFQKTVATELYEHK